MGETFMLTTLSSAVPFIQLNENRGPAIRKMFKSQERFSSTMPIRPPGMSRNVSPRPRALSPKNKFNGTRPAIDDITVRFIENPETNSPENLEDAYFIMEQLQRLLNYLLSDFNYVESTTIKKCLIKIEAVIFKLENVVNTRCSNVKKEYENIIERYMQIWNVKYHEYLEFCKNENSRLEQHQKTELEEFDEAFPTTIEKPPTPTAPETPKPLIPKARLPPRGKRYGRPLSLSLRPNETPKFFPDRITDLKKMQTKDEEQQKQLQQKQIQVAKARRERLIDMQKTKINSFVEFSNETRTTFIQIKKSVVNTFLEEMHLLLGNAE